MDVVVKLKESKALNETWTVRSLHEALKQSITIHSNAHRYKVISKPYQFKGSRNFQTRSASVESPTERRLSADALVANSFQESSRRAKGEPTRPCMLCAGTHFSDWCDKFPTIEGRKSQLSRQGRCLFVLRVVMTINFVLVPN